ncbi:MAG: hypothetical protein KAT65_23670 [Methanophagales archaeon]|nr:hypothetical protein [Methanophagales archaeon]
MMGDERLTEGSICDINVAYNSKRVGYTTSMSYMNELYEIARISRGRLICRVPS